MEAFSSYVQLIAAFITTVLLPLLLIKSKHKKSEAEAEKCEADNITSYAAEWKSLYEKKEQRNAELEAKIDSLYQQISELRDKLREANERNTDLAIQNQSLSFRRCNVHGCAERTPPSEF